MAPKVRDAPGVQRALDNLLNPPKIKKEIALKRVPIDGILDVELGALGASEQMKEDVREVYEQYVQELEGYLKELRPELKESPEEIRGIPESELFYALAKAFQEESMFGAVMKEGKTLTTSCSSGEKEFNCYSASILLSDVLTRMGKPVNVVTAPGHVFIAGEEQCMETTQFFEWSTFTRRELDVHYPVRWESGPENLLGAAFVWSGVELRKMGDAQKEQGLDAEAANSYNKAIGLYNKALEINPEDATPLKNMAGVYSKLGNLKKANECMKKAAGMGQF